MADGPSWIQPMPPLWPLRLAVMIAVVLIVAWATYRIGSRVLRSRRRTEP